MHDELTKVDIEKMQAELEDRIKNQRPKLIEEVKRCRDFGDLSENFEYKEAKRAKNWAEADAIRDQLRAMGVEIKDGKDGTTWTRI